MSQSLFVFLSHFRTMESLTINNNESLLKVADYLHDSGFKIEDIIYNSDIKSFKIKTKEYEYKGKFIQRKTNIIKKEYEFILNDIERYNLILKDKKGYDAVEEDYFNFIKIENERNIIIKTTFHDIKLEINRIIGILKISS